MNSPITVKSAKRKNDPSSRLAPPDVLRHVLSAAAAADRASRLDGKRGVA